MQRYVEFGPKEYSYEGRAGDPEPPKWAMREVTRYPLSQIAGVRQKGRIIYLFLQNGNESRIDNGRYGLMNRNREVIDSFWGIEELTRHLD